MAHLQAWATPEGRERSLEGQQVAAEVMLAGCPCFEAFTDRQKGEVALRPNRPVPAVCPRCGDAPESVAGRPGGCDFTIPIPTVMRLLLPPEVLHSEDSGAGLILP